MLTLFAQSAATTAMLTAVLWGYRGIARQSWTLGLLVGLGILVRAASGAALFAISYLDLPVLSTLHTGDGFWHLASDAESYYQSAAYASVHGLGTIPDEAVSPAYVRTLSLALLVIGRTPAVGFVVNLVCYVLICMIIVRLFSRVAAPWRDTARLYSIAAVTCSPALLFSATQALKDTLFVLLAVLLCAGAFFIASALDPRAVHVRRRLLTGWAVLLPAVYFSAGIRPYYTFIAWSALGLLFVVCGVTGGRPVWRRVAATAVTTLAAALIVFALGGGTQARRFVELVGLDRVTSRATLLLFEARGSYVQAGGGTSITGPTVQEDEARDEIVAGLRTWGPRDHLRAVSLGLVMLFVPIQVLRSLSIVEFEGGRNLLLATDIDTVIFDLTLVVGIATAARAWPVLRRNLPYVVYAASLTLMLTVLTAYAVTNYGTIVRLRVLPAITVWMLPLALRVEPGLRAGPNAAVPDEHD